MDATLSTTMGWPDPATLLTPRLPDALSVVCTVFRVLAALCILPVLVLTAIDVIGWTFFKLILRPLGWAHT
ncbi:hypothetical protein MNV49_003674, partial [Pseudohyphozyma bogoriensis]